MSLITTMSLLPSTCDFCKDQSSANQYRCAERGHLLRTVNPSSSLQVSDAFGFGREFGSVLGSDLFEKVKMVDSAGRKLIITPRDGSYDARVKAEKSGYGVTVAKNMAKIEAMRTKHSIAQGRAVLNKANAALDIAEELMTLPPEIWEDTVERIADSSLRAAVTKIINKHKGSTLWSSASSGTSGGFLAGGASSGTSGGFLAGGASSGSSSSFLAGGASRTSRSEDTSSPFEISGGPAITTKTVAISGSRATSKAEPIASTDPFGAFTTKDPLMTESKTSFRTGKGTVGGFDSSKPSSTF